MADIIFIDPQSYNNLCLYDKGVLSAFKRSEVIFIGSELWNCQLMNNIESKFWFSYNKIKNPTKKISSYIMTFLKIRRLIKKEKPKIVHLEWLKIPLLDNLFIKWLKNRNIKVVYTVHNILPHNNGKKYKKQYCKCYKLVDKLIVHSSITKTELLESFPLNPSKIEVIPHGIIDIEIEKGENLTERIAFFKNKLDLNGKIVFSSLGEQNEYKGTDLIVDVWSKCKQLAQNPNCHLIIAGKNSNIDFSAIKHLHNVTIIDSRISNCDFLSFIKLSDVILLPYRKISQSGVLFTAINNNIPVIVSNAGGLKEPLTYGKIGWLINKSSYENLSKCMLYLINNRDEIEKVKTDTKSFDVVKSAYSWERISLMTKRLYDSLIK
ncbi:MAG: glycosyltransferase family 4 protein [Lachnospiraceae bacterium]|nr:glycosyltransferase family 4 protein [Lachnospiraceae bacterium]